MQIRELRMRAGLDQAQLAGLLGISPAAVCRWELGTACPKTDRLPELADLLGCSIDALFGRSPPGERSA